MSKSYFFSPCVPSLDDPTQTLIPRQEHPRRQFVPTIKISNAYGKDTRFDERGNRIDPQAETDRIAKLAPKPANDSGEWVIVYSVFTIVFVMGILVGYFIAHA